MASLSLFFDIVARDVNGKRTLRDVGDEADRTGKKFFSTTRYTRRLIQALTLLGPALIPLAAGATALAAAFGAMGVAGVLAIAGIAREMKQGTTLGQHYQAALDDLQGTFQTLSHTAASNFLGPFQQVVRDLQARTPALNRQISDMSSITARTAAALTTGLVTAFQVLDPLMQDAATYVFNLSRRFEAAMAGPGLVQWGTYLQSVLPQATESLEDLVVAAGHLVAGLAPLGAGTLTIIRVLANLLNSLPVPLLTALATTATAVYVGFRAWEGLNLIVGKFEAGLSHLGYAASFASGAIKGLQIAAGVVGVVIGALTLLFTANAESQRRAEQAASEYADALRESHGVITEDIRLKTAQRLADDGVFDAARKLGLAQSDVTSAALGNASAQARVNAAMKAQLNQLITTQSGVVKASFANSELADAADKVKTAIFGENTALAAGTQKNRDLAAAMGQTGDVSANAADQMNQQKTAVAQLAAKYGVTVSALQTAQQHQQDLADDAAAARVQMILEGNAAGLLKSQLDALNGTTQDAATAQNAFDSSLVNMGNHTTKTGKKVVYTTTSIRNMSSASVALRGELLGQVANAQSAAEAYGQLRGSAEAGRQKLIALRKQIIDNAVAHGIDRKAVVSFIDSVLKIPPKAKTDVKANTSQANAAVSGFKKNLAGIHDKTVTLTTVYRQITQTEAFANIDRRLASGRLAGGGPIPGYARGTIIGPGTGTSDSILAKVRETGRILRVSAGEFVSTDESRRRNQAALEAGNRGATLTVATGEGGVLRIEGTLDTPWGPSQIRGVVKDEIANEAREISMGGQR